MKLYPHKHRSLYQREMKIISQWHSPTVCRISLINLIYIPTLKPTALQCSRYRISTHSNEFRYELIPNALGLSSILKGQYVKEPYSQYVARVELLMKLPATSLTSLSK